MAYGLTQSLSLTAASSQYGTAADSATLSVTGNMTLEGWVYFDSLPASGTTFQILTKYVLTGNQRSYEFDLLNTSGTYTLRITLSRLGTGASSAVRSVTWTPSTNTWYHIAVVYTTSGTADFYVDGVQQGTQQTGLPTSIYDSTAPLNLGSWFNGLSDYVDGDMSLWRVWSTNRTQTEIADNMCNVLGSTSNLSAEWTLDNVYTDNSGNGNTLTGVNSPTFATNLPSTCSVASVNTTNFFYMT